MAYFAPYIDESGLHIPMYGDILNNLIDEMKRIYGTDIYLEIDSQDYQMLSVFAYKLHDSYLLAQMIYNNRSPATAIGSAMDSIVKLNGIKRKGETQSICNITITGDKGTLIQNGIIEDANGYRWNLPPTISIPELGQIDVQAICQTFGSIYAPPHTISHILTPKKGWLTADNAEKCIVGQTIEMDSGLRARQKISTARPSSTVIEGTIGGIAEIKDVTRYKVYENDTNVTNEDTIPPHSICAVVEGGDNYEIADEIYKRKTPGCGTYGDVEISITKPNIYGTAVPPPICFFRPIYVGVFVKVTIKKLSGYVSNIAESIRKNVVEYLNALEIGEDLIISSLWGVALQAMPNITSPSFSVIEIKAGNSLSEVSSQDITILFNQVLRCESIDNIIVTVI